MTYSQKTTFSRSNYSHSRTLKQKIVNQKSQERSFRSLGNLVIILILVCVLIVIYILQVNETNSYSYSINRLQQQQVQLLEEYDALVLESEKLKSDRVIDEATQEVTAEYQPPEEIHIMNSP